MVLSRSLLRLKTSSSSYEPPKLPQTLIRLLSTTALHHDLPPPPPTPPPPRDPKNTLSARMSFVFDQIDAIQRDRGEKDEALQRIRAWRHSKQQQQQQVEVKVEEAEEEDGMGSVIRKEVELVHPWPEWIELMERLLQQNYFDHRRVEEDKMVENLPAVDLSGYAGRDMAGSEFWRDWAAVATACRNFGHDRFDILKSLSRKDIQVLAGYGCPSMDGKVVYSAKLLRKLAHVNEGDVCSACSLRSSCKKGFLLVPKEDEARTLDVIRVLLTFGFDSINGSVKNRPLMKMKSVKTVVRKLLHEIVKLAAIPIDPNLPRPVIKKPPPKVKQTPPPPKKRVGRDDVEMKKGDWLCSKCDFMNFAKNAICLQCDAKRPKRQLLPGEWECPECNFLNYRRNMACFHCECKRPPDEYMENQVRAKQQEPRTGSPGNLRKPNVSDAWNFDFDENESDGADVAAFEFADPPRMGDSASLNGSTHGETSRRFDDDFDDLAKMPRNHERSKYFSESGERGVDSHAQRTGFDDFDDEEYDVESYEIDMSRNSRASAISRRNLSEFENSSESEDFDDLDHCERSRGVKASISGSNEIMMGSDSEVDLVDQPKWKSSRYKGVSYGSDDDLNLHSDSDDDLRKGHERVLNRNITARQIRSSDRASSSRKSFESNDAWLSRGARRNDRDSVRNGIRGRMGNDRGGDSDRYNRPRHGMESGYNHYRNDRESTGKQKGNNRSGDPWSSDKPAQRERFEYNHNRSNEYNHRPKFDDRPRAQQGNSRRGDLWGSDRLPRREGFEYSRLRSNEHNERSKFDDRPRRQIIER